MARFLLLDPLSAQGGKDYGAGEGRPPLKMPIFLRKAIGDKGEKI